MRSFQYRRARSTKDLGGPNHPRLLAGGTTLLDLMKLEVETPAEVLDINALPLKAVERRADGGVSIGALVTNADLAHHPLILKDYAFLSQAILAGASAQLRNKATTGGNLLQRTRCVHFRDPHSRCNKREPGQGCDAIKGFNRNLAILGTSEACVASNPSDMNVAMMAAGARVRLGEGRRSREVDIHSFYLRPKQTPHLEFDMRPGEFITGVDLPAPVPGARSIYLKLRDRASYEFALASAAVILKADEAKKVRHVRIALGGVGTVPWRAVEAEELLLGQVASDDLFRRAAAAVFAQAKPQTQNGFKVELGQRCLVHALGQVGEA